jgi:hypothetical protein
MKELKKKKKEKCHNVAKYIKFYLGELRFNVTSTGNAGCFKKSFTLVFQMLLCGECCETLELEPRIVCTLLGINIFRNTRHAATFGISL